MRLKLSRISVKACVLLLIYVVYVSARPSREDRSDDRDSEEDDDDNDDDDEDSSKPLRPFKPLKPTKPFKPLVGESKPILPSLVVTSDGTNSSQDQSIKAIIEYLEKFIEKFIKPGLDPSVPGDKLPSWLGKPLKPKDPKRPLPPGLVQSITSILESMKNQTKPTSTESPPVQVHSDISTQQSVDTTQPSDSTQTVEALQAEQATKPEEGQQSSDAIKPVEESQTTDASQNTEPMQTIEVVQSDSDSQHAEAVQPLPAIQPVEQPFEQPVEQPAEQSAVQPVEQPAEQPVEQQVEQPVGTLEEQIVGQPAQQSANLPVEQPLNQPVEQPAEAVQSFTGATNDDNDANTVSELIPHYDPAASSQGSEATTSASEILFNPQPIPAPPIDTPSLFTGQEERPPAKDPFSFSEREPQTMPGFSFEQPIQPPTGQLTLPLSQGSFFHGESILSGVQSPPEQFQAVQPDIGSATAGDSLIVGVVTSEGIPAVSQSFDTSMNTGTEAMPLSGYLPAETSHVGSFPAEVPTYNTATASYLPPAITQEGAAPFDHMSSVSGQADMRPPDLMQSQSQTSEVMNPEVPGIEPNYAPDLVVADNTETTSAWNTPVISPIETVAQSGSHFDSASHQLAPSDVPATQSDGQNVESNYFQQQYQPYPEYTGQIELPQGSFFTESQPVPQQMQPQKEDTISSFSSPDSFQTTLNEPSPSGNTYETVSLTYEFPSPSDQTAQTTVSHSSQTLDGFQGFSSSGSGSISAEPATSGQASSPIISEVPIPQPGQGYEPMVTGTYASGTSPGQNMPDTLTSGGGSVFDPAYHVASDASGVPLSHGAQDSLSYLPNQFAPNTVATSNQYELTPGISNDQNQMTYDPGVLLQSPISESTTGLQNNIQGSFISGGGSGFDSTFHVASDASGVSVSPGAQDSSSSPTNQFAPNAVATSNQYDMTPSTSNDQNQIGFDPGVLLQSPISGPAPGEQQIIQDAFTSGGGSGFDPAFHLASDAAGVSLSPGAQDSSSNLPNQFPTNAVAPLNQYELTPGISNDQNQIILDPGVLLQSPISGSTTGSQNNIQDTFTSGGGGSGFDPTLHLASDASGVSLSPGAQDPSSSPTNQFAPNAVATSNQYDMTPSTSNDQNQIGFDPGVLLQSPISGSTTGEQTIMPDTFTSGGGSGFDPTFHLASDAAGVSPSPGAQDSSSNLPSQFSSNAVAPSNQYELAPGISNDQNQMILDPGVLIQSPISGIATGEQTLGGGSAFDPAPHVASDASGVSPSPGAQDAIPNLPNKFPSDAPAPTNQYELTPGISNDQNQITLDPGVLLQSPTSGSVTGEQAGEISAVPNIAEAASQYPAPEPQTGWDAGALESFAHDADQLWQLPPEFSSQSLGFAPGISPSAILTASDSTPLLQTPDPSVAPSPEQVSPEPIFTPEIVETPQYSASDAAAMRVPDEKGTGSISPSSTNAETLPDDGASAPSNVSGIQIGGESWSPAALVTLTPSNFAIENIEPIGEGQTGSVTDVAPQIGSHQPQTASEIQLAPQLEPITSNLAGQGDSDSLQAFNAVTSTPASQGGIKPQLPEISVPSDSNTLNPNISSLPVVGAAPAVPETQTSAEVSPSMDSTPFVAGISTSMSQDEIKPQLPSITSVLSDSETLNPNISSLPVIDPAPAVPEIQTSAEVTSMPTDTVSVSSQQLPDIPSIQIDQNTSTAAVQHTPGSSSLETLASTVVEKSPEIVNQGASASIDDNQAIVSDKIEPQVPESLAPSKESVPVIETTPAVNTDGVLAPDFSASETSSSGYESPSDSPRPELDQTIAAAADLAPLSTSDVTSTPGVEPIVADSFVQPEVGLDAPDSYLMGSQPVIEANSVMPGSAEQTLVGPETVGSSVPQTTFPGVIPGGIGQYSENDLVAGSHSSSSTDQTAAGLSAPGSSIIESVSDTISSTPVLTSELSSSNVQPETGLSGPGLAVTGYGSETGVTSPESGSSFAPSIPSSAQSSVQDSTPVQPAPEPPSLAQSIGSPDSGSSFMTSIPDTAQSSVSNNIPVQSPQFTQTVGSPASGSSFTESTPDAAQSSISNIIPVQSPQFTQTVGSPASGSSFTESTPDAAQSSISNIIPVQSPQFTQTVGSPASGSSFTDSTLGAAQSSVSNNIPVQSPSFPQTVESPALGSSFTAPIQGAAQSSLSGTLTTPMAPGSSSIEAPIIGSSAIPTSPGGMVSHKPSTPVETPVISTSVVPTATDIPSSGSIFESTAAPILSSGVYPGMLSEPAVRPPMSASWTQVAPELSLPGSAIESAASPSYSGGIYPNVVQAPEVGSPSSSSTGLQSSGSSAVTATPLSILPDGIDHDVVLVPEAAPAISLSAIQTAAGQPITGLVMESAPDPIFPDGIDPDVLLAPAVSPPMSTLATQHAPASEVAVPTSGVSDAKQPGVSLMPNVSPSAFTTETGLSSPGVIIQSAVDPIFPDGVDPDVLFTPEANSGTFDSKPQEATGSRPSAIESASRPISQGGTHSGVMLPQDAISMQPTMGLQSSQPSSGASPQKIPGGIDSPMLVPSSAYDSAAIRPDVQAGSTGAQTAQILLSPDPYPSTPTGEESYPDMLVHGGFDPDLFKPTVFVTALPAFAIQVATEPPLLTEAPIDATPHNTGSFTSSGVSPGLPASATHIAPNVEASKPAALTPAPPAEITPEMLFPGGIDTEVLSGPYLSPALAATAIQVATPAPVATAGSTAAMPPYTQSAGTTPQVLDAAMIDPGVLTDVDIFPDSVYPDGLEPLVFESTQLGAASIAQTNAYPGQITSAPAMVPMKPENVVEGPKLPSDNIMANQAVPTATSNVVAQLSEPSATPVNIPVGNFQTILDEGALVGPVIGPGGEELFPEPMVIEADTYEPDIAAILSNDYLKGNMDGPVYYWPQYPGKTPGNLRNAKVRSEVGKLEATTEPATLKNEKTVLPERKQGGVKMEEDVIRYNPVNRIPIRPENVEADGVSLMDMIRRTARSILA